MSAHLHSCPPFARCFLGCPCALPATAPVALKWGLAGREAGCAIGWPGAQAVLSGEAQNRSLNIGPPQIKSSGYQHAGWWAQIHMPGCEVFFSLLKGGGWSHYKVLASCKIMIQTRGLVGSGCVKIMHFCLRARITATSHLDTAQTQPQAASRAWLACKELPVWELSRKIFLVREPPALWGGGRVPRAACVSPLAYSASMEQLPQRGKKCTP